MKQYQWEATTLTGFVQYLATNLLRHGYLFYVQGQVPQDRDPRAFDQKLVSKYGADKTEGARYWRKQQGLANVRYVRFERTWVLLATHGEHPMKEAETKNLRDVREAPIQVGGYSLTVKRGEFLRKEQGQPSAPRDGRPRVRVLIARKRYRELVASFLSIACHRSAENLAHELGRLPFEPYAPIRKQLLKLRRLINAKRQAAGQGKVPVTALRLRRSIVGPFSPQNAHAVRFANSVSSSLRRVCPTDGNGVSAQEPAP